MEAAFVECFGLTAVERDIFGHLVAGCSNAAIARARGRSIGTVRKQVATTFRKFGVTTRRELRALLHRSSIACMPPLASASSAHAALLSERERDVLSRVDLGHSNKAIAVALGVAESTIAVFLSRAREKLRRYISGTH